MNNGEHIEYYSDGEIRYRCNYLGVNRHGEFINYYISGEISSKCNYLGDNRHGESTFYGRSGDILTIWYYIDGKSITELEWLSYNRNLKLEFLGL